MMIYLDNAATTFPKPRSVLRETLRCMEEYAGNPGRSSHPLSMRAAAAIYDARVEICELFGIRSEENVIFTKNATEALNLALFGLLHRGDHVITTNLEHNSVIRALWYMKQFGVESDRVDALTDDDVFISNIEAQIKPNTRAIACIHASNICPRVLPLAKIGELCRSHGILFIVDAAQSAGIYDIDIPRDNIDVLCAPGHKGLFGPMGTGVAVFCDGFDFSLLSPMLFGGTGMNSSDAEMGHTPPESYEAGTLAVPSIVGLCEGVRFVKKTGTAAIRSHDAALYRLAKNELLSLGATVYGDVGEGAVLLFNLPNIDGSVIAEALAEKGICVRAGLHCAPLAHISLGTGGDAVRLGFSPMNTERDIKALIGALHKIKND